MRQLAVRPSPLLSLLFLFSLLLAAAASADPPVVGGRGAIVADPVLAAPAVQPCVVRLYEDEVFTDFSLHDFSYAPPSACPGPFAKIVLRADFSVTTGRQFDRTANIWIGAVNLYFGTTQEPSANVAPSWRIERDISDYQSLLAAPQAGKIDLGNIVNETYTGILHGSAEILFYPLSANWPTPPRRPDLILPLASSALGGSTDVTGTGEFSRSFNLPRNIERVYLDVIAQSQAADEFWMTCVPSAYMEELQSCGNTAFRQTQVRIDGRPAGVAAVMPWLYTGAIDPGAWRPIPAVQTLAFEPWRVDLSPFAAQLNDGQPHTISLSVFNAGERFSVAANLLIYRDTGREILTGALTDNTMDRDPPVQISHDSAQEQDARVTDLSVTSRRNFFISGYVDTSRGRVTTTVLQDLDFSNVQRFRISDTTYEQSIEQDTRVSTETRVEHNGRNHVLIDTRRLPLSLAYTYTELDSGAAQKLDVRQQFDRMLDVGTAGFAMRRASLSNAIHNGGELRFASDGSLAVRTAQFGEQTYDYRDDFGACYNRHLLAAAGAITRVTDGAGCPGGSNRLYAFDQFANFASSLLGATVRLQQP
jgi:hypothetical protein